MSLLVVSYFALWQPARDVWMSSIVYPVLARSAAGSAEHSIHQAGRRVQVTHGAATQSPERYALAPPAGVKFLLPALFIVAIAPYRPDWVLFLAGHLVLAVLITSAFAGFVVGAPILGELGKVLQTYIKDAYSLIVPIFLYINRVRDA
jgi:hypothetical protein